MRAHPPGRQCAPMATWPSSSASVSPAGRRMGAPQATASRKAVAKVARWTSVVGTMAEDMSSYYPKRKKRHRQPRAACSRSGPVPVGTVAATIDSAVVGVLTPDVDGIRQLAGAVSGLQIPAIRV